MVGQRCHWMVYMSPRTLWFAFQTVYLRHERVDFLPSWQCRTMPWVWKFHRFDQIHQYLSINSLFWLEGLRFCGFFTRGFDFWTADSSKVFPLIIHPHKRKLLTWFIIHTEKHVDVELDFKKRYRNWYDSFVWSNIEVGLAISDVKLYWGTLEINSRSLQAIVVVMA